MTTKKSFLSALLVIAALGTVFSGATVLVRSQKMKRSVAAGQGGAQPKPAKQIASAKRLPASALALSCGTVTTVTTCTENAAITIPAAGTGDPNNGAAASPYPSNIVVSGVVGTVNKVTVTLNNLSHTSSDDLDMMLVGPNGQNIVIWSDAGGTAQAISNVTVTLDDAAASDLPDGPTITTGTFKPKNYLSTNNSSNNDHWPAPAPAPSALTSFGSAFNGISPNGTWSLYITDDATGDTGSVAGGWTLQVTVGAAAAPTTTTVTSSQPDFSISGSPVTFTATVVKTSDSSSVGAAGSVTFKDGATNLTCTEGGQPRPLNASGQATCTTSALTIGNHTINADYGGTAAFLLSSGSLTQVVDGPTTNPVAGQYSNVASIAIPQASLAGGAGAPASPYPSHITVSGLTGNISHLQVKLNNLSHSIPDDVDMLLVSPTGQNIVLMSDVGGTTPASNVSLTLDDAAASSRPDGGPLASGTFKPTNAAGTGTETYPAPAPAPSGNTTLGAAFNGVAPNGVWRLYIVDDAGGDTGSLAGGWSLLFTTTNDVATTTTVTSSQPDFSTTGQSVTFTATVLRADNSAPVTVGTVTFKEGATVLSGPTALNGSGQASFSTSSLTVGNHTIVAEYSGAPGQFNLSSGQFVQVVDNPTTQTGNEFCNTGTINVPATGQGAISGATASPYPSHITVSGFSGNVSTVTVEINNFTHTNPDDVDILLVSPTGQNIVLMSDVGGGTDVSNISITLDDAAAASLPDATALSSGTFKPTNIGGGDPYPAPAPAPSANTTLAGAFGGINPNGVWRLYIVDDAGGDVGTIGEWCLTISTPPTVTISDASLAEPPSGSSNMVFTVIANPAPTSNMDVTFTTEPDPVGANPATAGSDYAATSGVLNFTAGQSVQTISVPILADGTVEPPETFIVHLTGITGGPGATIGDDKATGTITPPGTGPGPGGAPGVLLISELRTSGPVSVDNDFVEIYNNSGSQFTVPAGGYGLFKMGAACSSTPVLIGTIPAGTPIPARGHFLFVGSAYSLGGYAGGNQTLTSNIESDRNVALFSTASLGSLSSATLIDAVGFGTNLNNNCDLLREGTPLPPASGSVSEYSFFRKMPTGFPQDTNDNSSDFQVVTTTPAVAVGSNIAPTLGAPGPENLASPLLRTSTVKSVLLDPAQASTSSPNRVRTQRASCPTCDNTKSNLGTLEVRRTFVNNTGANVTRLRFRIVDVTTIPEAGIIPGTAELHALNATGSFPVTVTGGGSVTVQSLTLEAPSDSATNGGGFNSTVSAGTVMLGTPLAPSGSINVNFLLGVQVSGSFRFFVIVEALP
jgi:subtilisin-like proprotein convertase family protein